MGQWSILSRSRRVKGWHLKHRHWISVETWEVKSLSREMSQQGDVGPGMVACACSYIYLWHRDEKNSLNPGDWASLLKSARQTQSYQKIKTAISWWYTSLFSVYRRMSQSMLHEKFQTILRYLENHVRKEGSGKRNPLQPQQTTNSY